MPTHTPPSSPRVALPRELHDFVVEMAIAVHKRSIYPKGHPILQGSVEAVYMRLASILADRTDVPIGVADHRLIIDGAASDDAHPLLSEFAARLGNHLVGAFRFERGVTREELDRFLDEAAQPVDEMGEPFGARRDNGSEHVAVHPVAFERLGLLGHEVSAAPAEHENATWRALSSAAMRGDAVEGDTMDPRIMAAAIGAGSGDAAFDTAVIERLAALLEELGERAHGVTAAQRQRVSDLIASIGEPALARLLRAGGAVRGAQVVRTANETLASRAVLELVRAASRNDAVSVSGAMLRLLQKLTTRAQQSGGRGAEAERVLRHSIRRLLDGWTLDNPNPEMYERLLERASTPDARVNADRRRDMAEPERVVDICLHTQHLGPAPEAALARLALRDGLAGVIARLEEYPPSRVREALVDRVLNEASLREYLAQSRLDVALLRQAVDRMKVRAVGALIAALEGRASDDAALLVDLLVRIGRDVLAPVGAYVSGAPPRLLRHFLAVFDQLDEWPAQVDPSYYATHPDVAIRREAIRYLIRVDESHDSAVVTALKDREMSIVAIGLVHLAGACPRDVAQSLIARYQEPELTPDLRVRLIRAVGSSATPEAEAWLGNLLLTRRWMVGPPRLRKPTPECIAAAAALVANYPESPVAARVISLVDRGRVAEYRRAVHPSVRGAA
ncbi:MAG: hypothetical protein IT361_13380 [Gemmatimonadaceae bacterium]|nr:hypothetical protein [Gemmatimonadaceae bacterium]